MDAIGSLMFIIIYIFIGVFLAVFIDIDEGLLLMVLFWPIALVWLVILSIVVFAPMSAVKRIKSSIEKRKKRKGENK